MTINIKILNSDVEGFTPQARLRLKNGIISYIGELIKESFRIEAGHNKANGKPDVTETMVDLAIISMKVCIYPQKISKFERCLRVTAALLSLFVGIIFDISKFQNDIYYLMFFIVIAVFASLAVIIVAWKG